MEFLAAIKELIPDYAKDIRLKLDGTITPSSPEGTAAAGVALAAAFAAKSPVIIVAAVSGACRHEDSQQLSNVSNQARVSNTAA